MEFRPLRLPGTFEIRSTPHQDERGYFLRVYDLSLFSERHLTTAWLQENQCLSRRKGIIRGLHFQKPPYTETKLVRVVTGAIFDVFVDLRRGSDTYGQWDAIELSNTTHNQVYIPKGFAHGYCTLSEETLVLYKVDASYNPAFESGLVWNDKTLNIAWPASKPILSLKDSSLGSLADFETPFG
jgi:dTDP-4-dehydrorhamnose 3,5-epimerase